MGLVSTSMNNKEEKSEDLNIDKQVDIFQQDNNKCVGNDETDFIIEDCSALHRLIQALQYHYMLNSEEFTEFCVNTYKNALNDHIHFMITHAKQIEQINNILIQKDDFPGCTVSKCNVFGRHYTKRRRKTTSDETYSFYMDVFDQFHHFIYHLFDVGLRISSNEINNIENK
eukprot:468849_1